MRIETTISVQGAPVTVTGQVSVNPYYDGSAYYRAMQPLECEYLIAVGACFDDDGLCDPWQDYDLDDDDLQEALLNAYLDGMNDLRPVLGMAA